MKKNLIKYVGIISSLFLRSPITLSFCKKKVLYTKFPHYEEIKQNFLCSNFAARPLPSSLITTTTTYVHLLIILWWDILLLLDVTRIFAQFLRNENKLMERINVISSNFVWIFGLDFLTVLISVQYECQCSQLKNYYWIRNSKYIVGSKYKPRYLRSTICPVKPKKWQNFWFSKIAIVGNTDKFCLTQSLFIAIPHPFISSANCSFLLPILQITSQPFSL